MLCNLCDSLNATDLLHPAKAHSSGSDEYPYCEHHTKYDDLVAAASSGCGLCQLLRRQCEEEEIAYPWSPDTTYAGTGIPGHGGRGEVDEPASRNRGFPSICTSSV